MNLTKIVITGGPCAGKTTGLSYLEQELSKKGFKVVFLNETATEIILNGLGPNANKTNLDFERNIINLQIEKEKLYTEYCNNLPDKNVLLVCDRGVMDCKCYMTDYEFDKALQELNLDKIQVRDNYDAVFHLVTAAKGAESAYTKANNNARRESLKEAIIADTKTMNAWTGHPHFRAIDNSTDFENKMKRLVQEICSFLGIPKPLEIERKFLIKKPDLQLLESLPNCQKVDIIQTYLNSNKDEELRIRQRGKDGSYIYTLTTKKKCKSETTRQETEQRISQKEYLTLLNNADINLHQVKKTRYCLMHNNRYFEIDVYPFSTSTAICEIELTNEKENFDLPAFISLIKEVTGNKQYSNYSLAKRIPAELQ
ncbi:MAG: AAA family ATPase [Clostridia bacterium]|nr:AAA family ATPase [Clostridia bacterium]